MEKMVLDIKTDLNTLPSVIEFNYDELKMAIASNIEKYNSIVVTGNDIKSVKKEIAKLKKLITAIEDARKEVKRCCLEPYNGFEIKCRELTGLIKEPVNTIEMQIKDFENVIKEQKYEELKTCYADYVDELSDIIEFDKILNPKWSNTTAKIDNLKAEIENTIDRIREELAVLDAEYSDKPYKSAVIAEYCRDYNLSKTLAYASGLRDETEKQKRVLEKPKEKLHNADNPSDESVGKAAFTAYGTKSQLAALKEFMKSNKIKYEVIR